jgi:anti-anti-sigma regulatory factor
MAPGFSAKVTVPNYRRKDTRVKDSGVDEEFLTSEPIRLPAILTISEVGELKQELLASRAATTVLDGEGVIRVDTAGLQLLLAFVKSIDARGGSLQWQNPSGSLLEAARLLGLIEALKITEFSHG